MADSEQSYTDRLTKLTTLRLHCVGFTPAFAPANAALTPAAIDTLIGTAGTANDNILGLDGDYGTNTTLRVELVVTVRARFTQALNYIKSNPAWSANYHPAKMIVDRVRGTRAPKTPAPVDPPDPGDPPKPPRNRGQQAYEELAGHLHAFLSVAVAVNGYAPPGTEITLAALDALLTEFRALNETIAGLEVDLSSARSARKMLYYGPDGLADRFQLIKAAIKGQYGTASAQWDEVKEMKW